MLTKDQCLNVPGSPYWCGAQDKQKGLKSSPHYYPGMPAPGAKRWGPSRMMQIQITEYELGYKKG